MKDYQPKAFHRKLITGDEYNNLLGKRIECQIFLNGYSKSIGKTDRGKMTNDLMTYVVV